MLKYYYRAPLWEGPIVNNLPILPSFSSSILPSDCPTEILVRSTFSLPFAKYCSFFTQRVRLGKDYAVTLNYVYDKAEGQNIILWEKKIPEHIFSPLNAIWRKPHSRRTYNQNVCSDIGLCLYVKDQGQIWSRKNSSFRAYVFSL